MLGIGAAWAAAKLFFGGNKTLIIIIAALVAVIAIGGFIAWLWIERNAERAKAAAAIADAAIYHAAAERNAQTVRAITNAQQRINEANARELDRARRLASEQADITAGVINVLSDNKDCGPSATFWLERVRQQQATGDRDQPDRSPASGADD